MGDGEALPHKIEPATQAMTGIEIWRSQLDNWGGGGGGGGIFIYSCSQTLKTISKEINNADIQLANATGDIQYK
jgi:hypothetical protein